MPGQLKRGGGQAPSPPLLFTMVKSRESRTYLLLDKSMFYVQICSWIYCVSSENLPMYKWEYTLSFYWKNIQFYVYCKFYHKCLSWVVIQYIIHYDIGFINVHNVIIIAEKIIRYFSIKQCPVQRNQALNPRKGRLQKKKAHLKVNISLLFPH